MYVEVNMIINKRNNLIPMIPSRNVIVIFVVLIINHFIGLLGLDKRELSKC